MTRAAQTEPTSRWPAPFVWSLWALSVVGLAVIGWFDHLLRGVGRTDLAPLHISDTGPYVAAILAAVTVGAVLASRRPRHPVGWLLLGLGLSVVASGAATGYASYVVLARAAAWPAAGLAAAYTGVSTPIIAACVSFVLMLTPTGSLPSPRWRPWARVVMAALVVGIVSTALLPPEQPYQAADNPLAVDALSGPLGVLSMVGLLITGLGIPVGAASLVVRFRRARGVERLQLRWLAWAAAVAGTAVVVLAALVPTGNEVLLGWATAVCVVVMPLATGAAILRYRLYDLDRIISRTVAYGLLTVLLGGAYAAVVLGLGQLLGQSRSLVVAGATLALAAAFQPARRRVQGLVDRRFNRRRYDAAQTIQAFSVWLREQVDLDALRGELLTVVDQTMQPTHASLWLRPQEARR